MIKRGILVFDHLNKVWKVWIRQNAYGIEQGHTIELRIKNQYYKAYEKRILTGSLLWIKKSALA